MVLGTGKHMTFKILTVVGARPQFVKCAPLRKLFDEDSNINEILVHTGQHYDPDMSNIFFTELNIKKPSYNLNINGKDHGQMTGEMMIQLEVIMKKEAPDIVLVYGDTNSTLAGALTASKINIPIVHVEAGLRSFNKSMPEEINRILVDHMSSLLFCSTRESVKNLSIEGVSNGVYNVGDIMYDVTNSVLRYVNQERARDKYLKAGLKLALCTIHRAENITNSIRLKDVVDYVRSYSDCYHIIFPSHPGTKAAIASMGISMDKITMIRPLSYLEIQELMSVCDLILTDSGGMQKEAYFHQVDCITLRNETEWVETVECGWNMLWTETRRKPKCSIPEYGDGFSADKILEIIKSYFNVA
jgi:UDP-GlcNAc3NAcA epimerase